MPLKDPVAIYTADTNARAQVIRHVLEQSGVEAYSTEDLSIVGLWMGGTLPGVHTPKVWVDRANAEEAAAILREYEEREAARRRDAEAGGEVEAVCDECGGATTFPASLRDTVQECPHCAAYIDVGADEPPEGWAEGGEDESPEEQPDPG
ncbi:MAG TPA: DUF2007 domain-containing protein [Gemmataceae bacterium]